MAITTGHNNDYAHMYGIERSPGGRVVFHQLRLLLQDGEIDVSFDRNLGKDSVKLLAGHNKDMYYRLCFDGAQWHTAVAVTARTGGFLNCAAPVANTAFAPLAKRIEPQYESVTLSSIDARTPGNLPITQPPSNSSDVVVNSSIDDLTNSVTIRKSSLFDKSITIEDLVCGDMQSQFLAASGYASVELCRDSFSKYSKFSISGVNLESGNQNPPVFYSLIHDGESVTY